MKLNRLLTALFILIVLSLSGSVAAQLSRRNFNRVQSYDVQHYVIRVSFDRKAKKVIGDTTIRLKPMRDLRSAEFDAVGISFDSVVLEAPARPLKFRSLGQKVVVTLDRTYKPSETIAIRFRHSSVPKKGVYFVDEEVVEGKQIHSEQIWTQGEADEARHWFPSFDFPSDKATFEQFITANDGETVIGN